MEKLGIIRCEDGLANYSRLCGGYSGLITGKPRSYRSVLA
ncbi:hypothetical protein C4K13_0450 [Pseudomonas chlororaphis subsp. aureofaciens]|nr:hypothetical protein C4K14_0464 [Pseudomonas chlororaphis subsp. aureofaciens]AZD89896.1 hypothetical protein C4K13_0450 [Pseudomonas chlororaphis subsp. aureofaciens]AZD96347.1 hypothetical protein C4K12_0452 [Pseudomonas chlororaphis subsp. aureofaciens]